MAKKTKRKVAHPTLPMQRQLNLQHEGKYFDLREIFDRLNAIFSRIACAVTKWFGAGAETPAERIFYFRTIQEEDRVIRINPLLDQPFVPLWFLNTCSITKCCIRWCRTNRNGPTAGVGCTPKNSIGANANFPRYRRARRWEEENLARFLR
jgi:hypothetical protein